MTAGTWKAVALAAALATAYAAGHYQGAAQGYAKASEQWQAITASITNHADDEQEETDTCEDASDERSR